MGDTIELLNNMASVSSGQSHIFVGIVCFSFFFITAPEFMHGMGSCLIRIFIHTMIIWTDWDVLLQKPCPEFRSKYGIISTDHPYWIAILNMRRVCMLIPQPQTCAYLRTCTIIKHI